MIAGNPYARMAGSVLDRLATAFALLAEPLALAAIHPLDERDHTQINRFGEEVTVCLLCGAHLSGGDDTMEGDGSCLRAYERDAKREGRAA